MKRIILAFLSSVMLLGFCLGGCGNTQLIEGDDKPQDEAAGEKTVAIEFESNASTGYQWQYVMSEEGIVKETGSEYIDDSPEDLVGAPGVQRWVFEGVAPGEVTLSFTYCRPWEPVSDSDATESVVLKVADDLTITKA